MQRSYIFLALTHQSVLYIDAFGTQTVMTARPSAGIVLIERGFFPINNFKCFVDLTTYFKMTHKISGGTIVLAKLIVFLNSLPFV